MSSSRAIKITIMWAVMIVVIVLIVFPIYWVVSTSIQETSELLKYPPSLFPKSSDFSIFWKILTKGRILRWTMNSFIVSLGVVLINLVLSVPASYTIAKYNFPYHKIILFLVLATQMISPAIMVVPLYKIFNKLNLLNTFWSLILSNSIITLPLSVWILTGFFQNIPKEIEEAALIDGATNMQIFMKVAMPLVTPAMVTVSILTFYDTWNEYLFAYTFIFDQNKWLGTVGLASFLGQFMTDWKAIMANSTIFLIPPMLVYLFLRKYIVRGIIEGYSK